MRKGEIKKLNELLKEIEGTLSKPAPKNFFQDFGKEAGVLQDSLSGVVTSFSDINTTVKNIETPKDFISALGTIPGKMINIGIESARMAGALQELNKIKAFEKLKEASDDFDESFRKSIQAIKTSLSDKKTGIDANVDATGKLTAAQIQSAGANKATTFSLVGLKKALTLSNILIGVKTALLTALKLALAAIGIGLLIAGFNALISLGPKLIGFFTGANKAAEEHEKAVEDLSERYGVSTEQIEADMERMGNDCPDEWEKMNKAAEEAAHTFGGCSDEIRGEIADLINEHGNYDDAMQAYKEQQIEMLTDVGSQWGMTGQEVHDALEDMTLDEFTAQQEAQLDELSNAWNTCGSEIQKTLEEQGITMEEWENQQEQLLQSNADEWGLCSETVREHMGEMGMSADEWAAHMGEAWDQFNEDVQSNVGDIINGFNEIPTEYGQSAEDLRKIMENNTETTREWQENMGKLAGEVSPEMLAHLEAMGPEFNSVIGEMLDCPDELQAWVDAMDEATEVGTQQALDNVEDPVVRNALEHELDATGRAVANNTALAEGYVDMHNDANARAKDVAKQGGVDAGDEYGNEFVKSAKSADYSDIPEAVTGAMNAGQGGMVQAMTSATTAIVSAFRVGMVPLNLTATTSLAPLVPLFQKSGTDMATGLQTGITSSTSSVTNAMTTLATGMHTAFKTANQETSSSGVYKRSGENIIKGLVQGIEAFQNRPITRLQTIATKMRNVYNNVHSIYQAIGREIMNGLNQGLLNGESAVMATANRIAANVARTMQSAINNTSPARMMHEHPASFNAGMDSTYDLSNEIINLNLPCVESIIGLQPSMHLSSATGMGSSSNDYSVVNNNQGLFEGANINWSGEQDIRRTMEKIAWVTKQEQARLWR